MKQLRDKARLYECHIDDFEGNKPLQIKDNWVKHNMFLEEDIQTALLELKDKLGNLECYQEGYGKEIDNIINNVFGEF